MRAILSLSFLCLPFIAMAGGPPTMIVLPIQTGSGVAPAIAQKYDAELRRLASSKAQVVSLGQTSKAMSKSRVKATCTTDTCGKKVTAAGQTRFALFGHVTNDDDIYKVQLILYDAAFSKRAAKVEEECELCSANEVNETLATALKSLAKPLSVAAPVVARKLKPKVRKVKAAGAVAVIVKTKPKGATVSIGGVDKGKTPLNFSVKPGTYTLKVTKAGYKPVKRKISALKKKVTLRLKLKVDPNAQLLTKTPVKPPVVKPTPTKAPKKESDQPKKATGIASDLANTVEVEPVGSAYNGLALGMVLGGIALTGVGTWLVILDDDVTCSDGRGRLACPNVYNTMGLGLTTFGLGAAAVGAGFALIAEDYIRTNRQKAQLINVGIAPTSGGGFFQLSGEF
jgi:hypothetical protein